MFAFISLLVILIVFLIAISFFIFRNINSHKQFSKILSDIESNSPYRKKTDIKPNNKNDFLKKDKEEELNVEKAQGVEIIPREKEHNVEKQTEIVGLATPKGFWTKFVMSQKLGFIFARMSGQNASKDGFWVNLIKAQAASQSKEKGKGR